jgi:hypothetical protein
MIRGADKERLGGGLIILLGTGAAVEGSSYPLGTLSQMGPGFFPLALGILLALCGLAILLQAGNAVSPDAQEMLAPEWRGWICILLGLVSFILLARHGGLLVATFVLVFIAALGDRQSTLRDAFAVAIAIAAVCVVVFWWALKVQLPLLGWS